MNIGIMNQPSQGRMTFESTFSECARHNDFAAIFGSQPTRAIVHKAFFNSLDENGRAPLHYAVSAGDIRMSEVLLANGAHPDLADQSGFTALMWASEKGHLALVQLLVDKYRACVNQQSANGESAIFLAVSAGHLEITQYLLQNGADPNVATLADECNTALQAAVATDRLDLVETLLNNGAWLEQQDLVGETALHLAVREEKIPMVDYLLRRGANPGQQNEDDETPRDLAEEFGCSQIRVLFRQLGGGNKEDNSSAYTFLRTSGGDDEESDDMVVCNTSGIEGRLGQMNVSDSNSQGGIHHISGSALRSSFGSGQLSPLSGSPGTNFLSFSSSTDAPGWKRQPMMLSSSGFGQAVQVNH